jgi:hypothetical protein
MNPFRHFGRTPWTGDRPVARSLPTQDNTGHTSVPPVGFEPTIPVRFEFLTAVKIQFEVFWFVSLSDVAVGYQSATDHAATGVGNYLRN